MFLFVCLFVCLFVLEILKPTSTQMTRACESEGGVWIHGLKGHHFSRCNCTPHHALSKAGDAEEGDTKERKVQSYEPQPPRDPHSDSKSHSPLFLWIMQQWGWGAIMSAPALQECAQAAVLSGFSASYVKDLAATGAHGHSSQNIERDLLSKYCKEMSTPEPFTWKVPMTVRERNAIVVKALECILFASPVAGSTRWRVPSNICPWPFKDT